MATHSQRNEHAAGAENARLRVAVIGSGISGLSAAWLVAQRHDVVLYEKDDRLGGHANTVTVSDGAGQVAIDTGFIVFNPKNYPNLVSLFEHLGVATAPSNMSFAVSMNNGRFEYSGGSFAGLLAQPGNALRPRFWSMLRDIVRFYRTARSDRTIMERDRLTLGAYLERANYGQSFQDSHLLPMAGAIWSAPPVALRDYPAAAFLDFFENHGLLNLGARPAWRTVAGGSEHYVAKIAETLSDKVRTNTHVVALRPVNEGVRVVDQTGEQEIFDRVIVAAHPDQALAMLETPTRAQQEILGAISYTHNHAVLHTDSRFMPRRRRAWASWNFLGQHGDLEKPICVTYWMNKLQPLASNKNFFVTLNPPFEPDSDKVLYQQSYAHPAFSFKTLDAQRQLHTLQGRDNIWFCGAYFGSGFHEDGLRAGLDVGESISGHKRPWSV